MCSQTRKSVSIACGRCQKVPGDDTCQNNQTMHTCLLRTVTQAPLPNGLLCQGCLVVMASGITMGYTPEMPSRERILLHSDTPASVETSKVKWLTREIAQNCTNSCVGSVCAELLCNMGVWPLKFLGFPGCSISGSEAFQIPVRRRFRTPGSDSPPSTHGLFGGGHLSPESIVPCFPRSEHWEAV